MNNTPTRPIRVPPDLWDNFGEALAQLQVDRSAYLRDVMRWVIHEPGAKAPKRPAQFESRKKSPDRNGPDRSGGPGRSVHPRS
jgi:hypothetical protein